MRQVRHVAVLVETSRSYGRGVLRGITRYNRERGRWSTYFRPHGLGDPVPAWLKNWQGDGILARIDNRRTAKDILASDVPVVNLRGTLSELDFPFVGTDNRLVAELGADHLLGRGFRNFAFCGYRRGLHTGFDRRCDEFKRLIKKAGCQCDVYCRPSAKAWEEQQDRLGRWIAGLPKPLAVMTSNDDRGLEVLDACRRADIKVPDDVAILGVDNDEYLCEMAIPALSSVKLNLEQIGYEAAALLDRLMSGRSAPKQPKKIGPCGIVVRHSTDVLAIEDPEVAQAVRFIRQHACEGIHLADVVEQVQVSRSTLAPRFRRLLGRTIYQEIRHVQIGRAKELLAGTHLPIKHVARKAGFRDVQYLTRTFGEMVGRTPASYRQEMRR
ncbi:MAG: DNA-binding transcriptional regulator [Pirellulales bacterium]|nr:DNA-binding transcriptional regulator [Pirellulales bacterium]